MAVMTLDGIHLPWPTITAALHGPVRVRIAPAAMRRIRAARAVVEAHGGRDAAIYGINTGFGIFARTRIAPKALLALQRNFILSHCSGVGETLSPAVVRVMLLAKLHTLTRGYSGVRPVLVRRFVRLLNGDCLSIVPAQGSVGASGDLAPLAHLAAPLLGCGAVWWRGARLPAAAMLRRMGWRPFTLAAKEGLALANGTQAMAAVAVAALALACEVIAHAEIAGALTIEGLLGSVVPFDARLHRVRPHPGARASAAVLRKLLAGSRIVRSHRHCDRVQDPYALRCIPTVHGVAREAYAAARATVARELDAVTDNPIVFAEDDAILSGGNFHGAPVAFAMDQLAIAMTTLGSMAERRIEQLTNPKAGELAVRGLTPHPGLHSGYMMAHVTAASLVSENKTLAHPASVDTIPTWAGQEDHVSMGMWAARKTLQIVENTAQIVAIELLCAAQAIDLHPVRYAPGRGTKAAYAAIRHLVPILRQDRYMAPDLLRIRDTVASAGIRKVVEENIGEIVE
ncbi:MAG: histidine ammonia-lyase [Deltaproteobacteria bacterium]|nr:histidine ammonia-lyase [Deltaproteobacteria bacterium]